MARRARRGRPAAKAAASTAARGSPRACRRAGSTCGRRSSRSRPDARRSSASETFAPILYFIRYRRVRRGPAPSTTACRRAWPSAIFTGDVREAERFCSAEGSDCGIANVNIGTSGAEIGGAFGGEKETGGGRESGSDAWKAYMRRADQHHQLLQRPAPGPGHPIPHLSTIGLRPLISLPENCGSADPNCRSLPATRRVMGCRC